MKPLSILATIAAAFMPAISYACGAYACNNVYVETLYTNNYSSGHVYIYTSGNEAAATDCDGSTNYVLLKLDTDAGRAIYSNLLVAVATARKIDIVMRRNGQQCEVSYTRFNM